MRLWQEQIRTSELMHQAGFRWRRDSWEKRVVRDSIAYADFRAGWDRVGRVNAESFAGYEPGRLLFHGWGAKQDHDGRWQATFTVRPSRLIGVYNTTSFRMVEAT